MAQNLSQNYSSHPNQPQVLLISATLLEAKGEFNKAAKTYKAIQENYPDTIEGKIGLGRSKMLTEPLFPVVASSQINIHQP